MLSSNIMYDRDSNSLLFQQQNKRNYLYNTKVHFMKIWIINYPLIRVPVRSTNFSLKTSKQINNAWNKDKNADYSFFMNIFLHSRDCLGSYHTQTICDQNIEITIFQENGNGYGRFKWWTSKNNKCKEEST